MFPCPANYGPFVWKNLVRNSLLEKKVFYTWNANDFVSLGGYLQQSEGSACYPSAVLYRCPKFTKHKPSIFHLNLKIFSSKGRFLTKLITLLLIKQKKTSMEKPEIRKRKQVTRRYPPGIKPIKKMEIFTGKTPEVFEWGWTKMPMVSRVLISGVSLISVLIIRGIVDLWVVLTYRPTMDTACGPN